MTEATELLMQLVTISSVTPRDEAPSADAPGEEALATFVSAWLNERGVSASVMPALPGRPNVIATVPGQSLSTLLLETHLDTVEVTGMAHPFTPRIVDGRLFGRGAADAKGSLAAFMVVLVQLHRAPEPPPVAVRLVAVADEEHAYRGVLAFLDHEASELSRYCGALVGEPTGLVAGIAHKGCVRFTVHVDGVGGHSSRPHEAVNAIAIMAALVQHIEADVGTKPAHPLLGSGTRTVTRIAGGEGPNLVPGHCEIDLDRRTLPGEDPEQVRAAIQAELEAIAPGRVRVDAPFTIDYALDTDPGSVVVGAVSDALRSHGFAHEGVGMPFGTDASKLARAGIPSVVIGPGSIDDAHTSDESVDLSQVASAVDVVMATVARMGRGRKQEWNTHESG